MSLISMGANFLCHLVNVLVGHRLPARPRILASLGLNILLFLASTLLTRLDTDPWQLQFYCLTLAFALLFNINDSIFQGWSELGSLQLVLPRLSGAYTAVMARFPPAYMGAMMQGQVSSHWRRLGHNSHF